MSPSRAQLFVAEVEQRVAPKGRGGLYRFTPDGTVGVSLAATALREVELCGIESHDRRRGRASKVLRELTELADRFGVTLHAIADSEDEDGLTTEELTAWYARHGFVRAQDGALRRLPTLKVP